MISVLLWLGSQLAKTYTHVFNVPVVYKNLPKKYYKGFLPNDTLYVKARLTGYRILKNKIAPPVFYLDVQNNDLINEQQWTPFTYKNQISELLGGDNRIVTITPELIHFDIRAVDKKKLPVVADVDLSFKPGFAPVKQAELKPDSVWAYGSSRVLDSLTQVTTRHYDINNIGKNVSKRLTIKKINGVKFNVNEVAYNLPVSEIIEGQTQVKLYVKKLPSGLNIILLPETVTVKYKYFKSDLDQINLNSLKVSVFYKPQKKYWKIVLDRPVNGIFDVQFIPEKVSYLIKQTHD